MAPPVVNVFVYYNGAIIDTNIGTTFQCDHPKALRVHDGCSLEHLKEKVHKKLRLTNHQRVATVVYRYPMLIGQGSDHFQILNIEDDDDMGCMWNVFHSYSNIGTIELYVTFEDVEQVHTQPQYDPTSQFDLNQTHNYQNYYDQTNHYTPSQPHQLERQGHSQAYHSYEDPSQFEQTTSEVPSQLPQPDNQTYPQNIHTLHDPSPSTTHAGPPHVPPISFVAGIHNEEAGEFSENEDDLMDQPVDDEESDDGSMEPSHIPVFDPPKHFKTLDLSYSDPFSGYDHLLTPSNSQPSHEDNCLSVGMQFHTKGDVVRAIKNFHIRRSIDYEVYKSDPERYLAKCVSSTCNWRCRASVRKKGNKWLIGRLEGEHTCVSTSLTQDHRKLDSDIICESIKTMVKENPSISVSVMIAHIRSRFNYTTTYRKAWMGKQKAIEQIYGNWEKSYNDLPTWLLTMKTFLPGTIVEMETLPAYNGPSIYPGHRIFHRLFWAFEPCIRGFAFCKPIVQVDGTWLYGRYKGTLLLAVAQDGDNHIVPLAFAIVEGETGGGWSFFLKHLRRHVTPQPGLCLISDRHESIKSAYLRPENGWLEPPTVHVFCIRHIAQNFMREFKNIEMKKVVINMGYALNNPQFNYYHSILRRNGENFSKWVDNIPIEKWTQSHDDGKRWGHMTTNLAESINAVLKGTRYLPITALVTSTYYRLGKLFGERGRQVEAQIASGRVFTEKLVNIIETQNEFANTHHVTTFDRRSQRFSVEETINPREGRPAGKFSVDLQMQKCDCGKFQALHLPCSHAMAAAAHSRLNQLTLVADVYKLEHVFNVYRNEFIVIPNDQYWPIYEGDVICHNPEMRRSKKGRPQSSRIRTDMDIRETGQRKRCGLCREEGHTRKNCPNKADIGTSSQQL